MTDSRKRSRENAFRNGTDKSLSQQVGWLKGRLRELEDAEDRSRDVLAMETHHQWELGLCEAEIARRKAEGIWTLDSTNGHK